MKKFLVGLALALGAAIVFQKSRTAGMKPEQRPLNGGRRRRNQQRETPAEIPQPQSPEAGSAATARAAAAAPPQSKISEYEETPGRQMARSAEEVLNSATRQQLLSVYGIGPVLADRIIQNRPYSAAHDVVAQGIIPESTFVQLRKQLLDQSA